MSEKKYQHFTRIKWWEKNNLAKIKLKKYHYKRQYFKRIKYDFIIYKLLVYKKKNHTFMKEK